MIFIKQGLAKMPLRPEPTLAFYKEGICDICKSKDPNQILACVTTCDGEYGYLSFCKPCILRKFQEEENKDKVPLTTLG